jgi:hypothetical protein
MMQDQRNIAGHAGEAAACSDLAAAIASACFADIPHEQHGSVPRSLRKRSAAKAAAA